MPPHGQMILPSIQKCYGQPLYQISVGPPRGRFPVQPVNLGRQLPRRVGTLPSAGRLPRAPPSGQATLRPPLCLPVHLDADTASRVFKAIRGGGPGAARASGPPNADRLVVRPP